MQIAISTGYVDITDAVGVMNLCIALIIIKSGNEIYRHLPNYDFYTCRYH